MSRKTIRLTTLAKLINEQFPQWVAEVEEGQYTIEREWPGHRAVLSRRTVKGNCLRVRERKLPSRPVYECNLAAWYRRAADALDWFITKGGKLK